jgi:lysophospholipid acyltransferase (LPLAT)-like uncharacterized protein
MSEKLLRPGQISFAPVPFVAPWYQPLLEPLVVLGNVAFAVCLMPSWYTARVRWEPSPKRLDELVAGTEKSIIYFSWHAYEPLLVLTYRDFPPHLKPAGIGHDGLLSRMLQRSASWFGMSVWVYRRNSPIRPTQQIIDLLKTGRCNIGLIPDSGGPYGKVKPGLPEIARATGAWLVPVIIRARGLLKVKRPWRGGLPLPYCSLVAYHGRPLDGSSASVAQCQAALDELGEKVGCST